MPRSDEVLNYVNKYCRTCSFFFMRFVNEMDYPMNLVNHLVSVPEAELLCWYQILPLMISFNHFFFFFLARVLKYFQTSVRCFSRKAEFIMWLF